MIIEHDKDGRIFHVISDPVPPEVEAHYVACGALSVPGKCGIDTHYIVDGELKERPACTAEITLDGRTAHIGGADGSAISVIMDGVTVPINDTDIEFEEPGKVTIVVTPPWPYVEVRRDFEIK